MSRDHPILSQPIPGPSPEACFRFLRPNGFWGGMNMLPFRIAEIRLLQFPVILFYRPDLPIFPAFGPFDTIMADPVVGSARKVPVANGWMQRHRLAIENQLPIRGGKRCDHLTAAPTTAAMNGGRVANGDVKHPWLKRLGDALDEFMTDGGH